MCVIINFQFKQAPIHVAAENGYTEVIEVLFSHSNCLIIDVPDKVGVYELFFIGILNKLFRIEGRSADVGS